MKEQMKTLLVKDLKLSPKQKGVKAGWSEFADVVADALRKTPKGKAVVLKAPESMQNAYATNGGNILSSIRFRLSPRVGIKKLEDGEFAFWIKDDK